jgi:putative restriction endonuclease
VWKGNGEQAPHKPLLLLLAIGRLEQRWLRFREIDGPLTALIREYGPPRRSNKASAHYPFWYLKTDGFWEVHGTREAMYRTGKREPGAAQLRTSNAYAGFTQSIYVALSKSMVLRASAVSLLLEETFPPTIHQDVLASVGLSGIQVSAEGQRDPNFRERVLSAYNYCCAVCGYDGRMGYQHVGLEAAHIRWVQASGPSDVRNGIALCSLHHKLFDMGAFRVRSRDFKIEFSRELRGASSVFNELLGAHGGTLQVPRSKLERPALLHLEWHDKERFRAPALEL